MRLRIGVYSLDRTMSLSIFASYLHVMYNFDGYTVNFKTERITAANNVTVYLQLIITITWWQLSSFASTIQALTVTVFVTIMELASDSSPSSTQAWQNKLGILLLKPIGLGTITVCSCLHNGLYVESWEKQGWFYRALKSSRNRLKLIVSSVFIIIIATMHA